MTTLSLTLPISCQICLGKVKDPVICQNNHAFCTVCLDVWLQSNGCCPTCRVDITKDNPYRKVIGSNENNETLSLQTRMQLRKTRLGLLRGEYETEVENLSRQLNLMTQENEKLKKDLKTKEQEIAATGGRPLLSSNTCNIEALSSLTKKLQEISTTYDDVRRDMTKLQQEKEQLQRENDDLKNEVSKLKEDSMFTKSPKRYEKFTITGLKAKVEQYEKENQQLKKALQNSDKYVEQLQMELRMLKTENAKSETRTTIGAQHESESRDIRAEVTREETVPNSMVARQLSHDQFEATVASITPLNRSNSSEFQSCTVLAVSTQHEKDQRRSPQNDGTTPTTSQSDEECSRDLFPATKKLLALKKIHETRSSPSPQSQNVHHVSPVPSIDLPWSSGVPYMNYDSPSDASEETSVASNKTPPQHASETFSCSFTQDRSQCSESASNNVILTAAGPWALPSTSSTSEQMNFDQSCKSPKRNTPTEPFLLNKKIKIEKD